MDRPDWQRDALRRLVVGDGLTTDDIHELSEICKRTHGLADQQEALPLAKEHVPYKGLDSTQVSLISISHHRGVNALAEGQSISFGPGLTLVYGDNATGKTGYIRILKSACHARGQERVLGNVIAGRPPLAPVVSIKYRMGTEAEPREWAGNGDDNVISRVSVFDTQCAAVYLTKKTDVAFRPFGLDLFDQLVQACKAVRARLESEQRPLFASRIEMLQAQVPLGTAVSKLLAGITSLTKPQTVQALAALSAAEEARLMFLEKSLLDLEANDPEKLIRHLTVRAGRVRQLSQHIKDLENSLSGEAVAAVFEARREARRKSQEAERLRAATFPTGMLAGTGSELWTVLWESARRFSQEQAYPGDMFPVVNNGAHCVLCQQDLDSEASRRLEKFEEFVASMTERELREARETLSQLQRTFFDLKISDDAVDATLKEIRIEHEAEAGMIAAALITNERRRQVVSESLIGDTDLSTDCPDLVLAADKAEALTEQLEERIETLRGASADDARRDMIAEERELRARKLLAQHEALVLSEIERKKRLAAYGMCIDDTKTYAITAKSTSVTRSVVTNQLKQSFQGELLKLNFRHVEVELKEIGGEEGVLYHKLILTRAPGVELPKVVSEGEQRCLSIAAFLAELSTTDDLSSIVFDDPVSSLDYKWREAVARRLVAEGKTRQVIVFTHDIVFLLLLKQFAEEQGVEQLDQHVRQLPIGAGVCAEELPWVALKVSSRIGYLKKLLQHAEKVHHDGHLEAYDREASMLYGYLREAWERGLEEVLLGGVVERYRPGVQTQQVALIADITAHDCQTLETAMTKCSRWLTGHDQAPAARADIPSPDELKADIEALVGWVAAIRKRRK